MNKMSNLGKSLAVAMLSLGMAVCTEGAHATENGGSSYPLGLENFMTGALPPPGLYGMTYGYFYSADKLMGNNGKAVPVDFNISVDVIAPRLIWVSGYKLLGGDFAMHTVLPLVYTNATVANQQQSSFAQGDATIGAGIGYHFSPNFHLAYGVDVVMPTGQYSKNDIDNAGRNYWVAEPLVGLEYLDPTGFNASAKVIYNINFTNEANHYKSGQEAIVDYAVGWGFGRGWTLGVGGYLYRQTTDDEQYGTTIYGNKGRAIAIGPSIKYDSGHGWFVTAKWQQETDVYNRPEGSAFVIKAAIPL